MQVVVLYGSTRLLTLEVHWPIRSYRICFGPALYHDFNPHRSLTSDMCGMSREVTAHPLLTLPITDPRFVSRSPYS